MLIQLPLWERIGKKVKERLEKLRYAGSFTQEVALERGMRLVVATAGFEHEAIRLCLYWLVDETDGVIADAKFQALGPTGLIASADAVCELVLRKNYDQASRFSADLIERHLASPAEWAPYLNRVIEAIDHGVQQCGDIPFASTYEETPLEDFEEIPGGLPGWDGFVEEKKLSLIEEVMDKEIRPYVELDAGGVSVLGLRSGCEVRIAYEGSCTSCHASTGSTLNAIQKILRSRLHPSLSVIPEL